MPKISCTKNGKSLLPVKILFVAQKDNFEFTKDSHRKSRWENKKKGIFLGSIFYYGLRQKKEHNQDHEGRIKNMYLDWRNEWNGICMHRDLHETPRWELPRKRAFRELSFLYSFTALLHLIRLKRLRMQYNVHEIREIKMVSMRDYKK